MLDSHGNGLPAVSSDVGESGIIHTGDSYRRAKELFEKHYFEEKLRKFRGNITRVAQEVGLERSHLHKKLKQLGITHDVQ